MVHLNANEYTKDEISILCVLWRSKQSDGSYYSMWNTS